MPFTFLKNYFTINPTFNYSENWYFQSYDLGFNLQDTTLDTLNFQRGFGRDFNYNFGASLNTRIFGTYSFLKGKIKALRHIMTPSVGFTYTPDFSLNRYVFTDSYVDSGSTEIVYNRHTARQLTARPTGVINIGLQNVFNGKKRFFDSTQNTDKFNIIDNLSFNTGYDIFADSLNWSNISSSLNTRVFNNLISLNAGASFSIYKLNENGTQLNELFLTSNFGLAQIASANFGLSANLNPEVTRKRREQAKDLVGNDQLMQGILQRQLIDFTVPWSLNINANANYNPFAGEGTNKWNVTPSFDGDISISPLWKVTYRTGYDVINQQIAETTEIGIARSLHCWSIQFDWNPVGSRRQFSFTLRPNASILQDLKLNKRNYWWNLF